MGKKIIDNWKQAWRLYSIRVGVLMALLPELIWRTVEVFGAVLPAVPQEIKEYLPYQVRAALAIAGLVVIVARLWRQGNVDKYFDKDR